MTDVVHKLSKLDMGRAWVTISGSTPLEVTDMTAKNMAIKAASQLGLNVRGISGYSGAYLANEKSPSPIASKEEVYELAKSSIPNLFYNEFCLTA